MTEAGAGGCAELQVGNNFETLCCTDCVCPSSSKCATSTSSKKKDSGKDSGEDIAQVILERLEEAGMSNLSIMDTQQSNGCEITSCIFNSESPNYEISGRYILGADLVLPTPTSAGTVVGNLELCGDFDSSTNIFTFSGIVNNTADPVKCIQINDMELVLDNSN